MATVEYMGKGFEVDEDGFIGNYEDGKCEEWVQYVKAQEGIDELTEEDAEKLSAWLKRDIDDAIDHMSDADSKFVDWLGFKTELLESTFLQMLLDTADPTTVELKQIKERAEHPHEYHTGEITGPGTLICDECDEKLHFYKAGKIPPCPKCHETRYHR